MKNFSPKIIIRREIRRDGSSSVCLQTFVKARRIIIPLNIYVLPKNFDKKKQKIIGKNSEAETQNKIIESAVSKANRISVEYFLNSKELTAEAFKNEMLREGRSDNFYDFMEKEINLLKGMRASGSIAHYKGTLKKLRNFKSKLFFGEIDYKFLQDFETHLKLKCGLSLNSRWVQHKNIKCFLNLAIKKGINNFVNPYKNFKIVKSNPIKTHLTQEEVERLETLYKSGDCSIPQKRVLQHFLFSCYTGLRISDIHQITAEMIQNKTLKIMMQKTKNIEKTIEVPLSKKAIALINKKDFGEIFQPFTDQYTNRALKDIARLTGIKKKVTTHTARHTFATIFLEIGGSVEVLKELLGHQDIATTMVYVHISDKRKREQINLFDKK